MSDNKYHLSSEPFQFFSPVWKPKKPTATFSMHYGGVKF